MERIRKFAGVTLEEAQKAQLERFCTKHNRKQPEVIRAAVEMFLSDETTAVAWINGAKARPVRRAKRRISPLEAVKAINEIQRALGLPEFDLNHGDRGDDPPGAA